MELSKYIDQTLLKPASISEIEKLCKEALKYQFASVCIQPCYTHFAKKLLKGSSVAVCTVLSFPLGADDIEVKKFAAKHAALSGADEVDMVMNLSLFLSGEKEEVLKEIQEVKEQLPDQLLKVIIETCLLSSDQKRIATELVAKSGADYVKTSTGFSKGGATLEDVELLKKASCGLCKVKASGGIRTKEEALAMIAKGAERIGTSSGAKLCS